MAQVFISYAHAEAMIAKTIVNTLEHESITCWYYERDFIAGSSHIETTTREISQCTVFLILVSPAAITSDFVFPELLHAVAKQKNIVPVLVGISHKKLEQHHPRWCVAFGFSTTLPWETGTCLSKIIEACRYLLATTLSQQELDRLMQESVDPISWGTDSFTEQRIHDENSRLSDAELVALIEKRNRERKPTYKLRQEYLRRLRERGK